MKCKFDWAAIEAHRSAGNTLAECCERFGFRIDAWYKAVRRGAITVPPAPHRGQRLRYDWEAVRRYYDEGHSYRECRIRFGFASDSWTRAVRRGDVVPRPRAMPLQRILEEGRCTKTIKGRLFAAGIFKNQCDDCGLTEWRGKPLSIQLDHINGDCNDNRLENLRMLCPNCHSQTVTWGTRNLRRKRMTIDDLPGSFNGRTAASEVAYRGSSP